MFLTDGAQFERIRLCRADRYTCPDRRRQEIVVAQEICESARYDQTRIRKSAVDFIAMVYILIAQDGAPLVQRQGRYLVDEGILILDVVGQTQRDVPIDRRVIFDVKLKAQEIQGDAVTVQRYGSHLAGWRKPLCLQMSAVCVKSPQQVEGKSEFATIFGSRTDFTNPAPRNHGIASRPSGVL